MTISTFSNVKKWIEVSFQKEGIHCYPEAATNPDLADVAFLAHPHRHMFHFKVRMTVKHDNRDVEFIQLKRALENHVDTNDLNNKSCEMMAQNIINYLMDNYKYREFVVSVFEDGENGAIIEYAPYYG